MSKPVLIDITDLVESIEKYIDHANEFNSIGKLNIVAFIGERVAAKYDAQRKARTPGIPGNTCPHCGADAGPYFCGKCGAT